MAQIAARPQLTAQYESLNPNLSSEKWKIESRNTYLVCSRNAAI